MIVLFCFCICVHVGAQLQIPTRIDGFVYKKSPVWGSSVIVEAFFDPMCPDSRDSWPSLKQALHHYSPHVSLVFHTFALPYHSNSFTSSRALHIANKLNSSSAYPLLELFFKIQDKYYNKPTYNLPRSSIVHDFSKLAAKVVGKNSLTAIISGFNDTNTDSATRVSFKYGCSRAVTGTPYFFVNGMPLLTDSSLSYKKWKSIIDPLLEKKEKEF